jgi:hypothetical protein
MLEHYQRGADSGQGARPIARPGVIVSEHVSAYNNSSRVLLGGYKPARPELPLLAYCRGIALADIDAIAHAAHAAHSAAGTNCLHWRMQHGNMVRNLPSAMRSAVIQKGYDGGNA